MGMNFSKISQIQVKLQLSEIDGRHDGAVFTPLMLGRFLAQAACDEDKCRKHHRPGVHRRNALPPTRLFPDGRRSP